MKRLLALSFVLFLSAGVAHAEDYGNPLSSFYDTNTGAQLTKAQFKERWVSFFRDYSRTWFPPDLTTRGFETFEDAMASANAQSKGLVVEDIETTMNNFYKGTGTSFGNPLPMPNPLPGAVVGGVIMVLMRANIANGPGSEIFTPQDWRNRVALKRYLATLVLTDACSKSGGTPVVTPGGVNCIPPPPPPEELVCAGGRIKVGNECVEPGHYPGEEKEKRGGSGRYNDNGQDSPFPGDRDQDCWQEGGVWFCI
jgi:hypothetical protein